MNAIRLDYTKLPKMKLLVVEFRERGERDPWFMKKRGANFAATWIGPLFIAWRMPWIKKAAAQLFPHAVVSP